MLLIDLTGQRFGKLVVLAPAIKVSNNPNRRWQVQCDCGKRKVVFGMDLRAGRTKSCGCGISDENRRNPKSLRHGHSKRIGSKATPEYNIWVDMIRRCDPTRAREKEFKYYAGRKITVCPRWMRFENFLADMKKRPSRHHTIDRINNDGNYEPGNVRWATRSQQARNTRSNRLVTYAGTTKSLVEWSEQFQITAGVLNKRLTSGWSIKRAFTEPVGFAKGKIS